MELREIGSLTGSVVGLGTNNFGFRMDESEVPRWSTPGSTSSTPPTATGAASSAWAGRSANAAAGDWVLTPDEVAEVDAITAP